MGIMNPVTQHGEKGISPVVASIMLVLIVISLTSSYIVFTNRISQGQQQAAGEEVERVRELTAGNFHIDNIHDQTVVVVNDGTSQLDTSGLAVTINNKEVNFTAAEVLDTGEAGELKIRDLWKIEPGRHQIRVRSSTNSDTERVRVSPIDGAVTHLRFDEDSGNIVHDSSGNGFHGEIINPDGARWVEGKIGGALDLEEDATVNITDYWRDRDDPFDHSYEGNYRGPATISGWVKPSVLDSNNRRFVTDNNGNEGEFELRDTEIEYHWSGGATYVHSVSLEEDSWYHVTMEVHNPAKDEVEITAYLNGHRVGSDASTDCTTHCGPDGDLNIGTELAGQVDELIIYDRPLPASDIYKMEKV